MNLTVKRLSTKGLPLQLAMALCNGPRDASAFFLATPPRVWILSDPCSRHLMGRRHRCSRKRTRTPSGVCSADRNIRAAPARIMIDGQSSQRYVPAAPPSGHAFTACQVQYTWATVELTRHPCQLAAHFPAAFRLGAAIKASYLQVFKANTILASHPCQTEAAHLL
jgi:hypothetical protein